MWNRSPGPREKALPSSMTTRQRPETTSPTCSRSEEHTSELQSQSNLVCRLLLEKKRNAYIDHAAFLVTINPDTNKIPKHLFQCSLNIYNNYFNALWMPDRSEANPNELNQDDARYGFSCCHLKNMWTSPRPPETEL